MAEAILLENLSKVYSTKQALSKINLNIPQGSIFGLLGPNGAGKSTLINILAGTVIKTSGMAKICGINIDVQAKAARYLLGVVPQEIIVDTFFPVYKALEFYAGYYGIRQKDRKTAEIIAALGLTDKANAMPRQLSGGMKRRFLVAKAMVHNPPVLILDEPTAGVDIELRNQLWEYVKYLNSQGTTIVLTTHYLQEAEQLCDHIAFINHGKIILQDKKEHLLNNLGYMQVKIELVAPIPDILKLPEGVEQTAKTERSLSLRFKKEQTNLGQIITHLQQAGLVIADLQTEQPDLEDVFREVIK